MKLQSVILAAGKGTRMQSDIPKPLIPVNGVPMLTTLLNTLEKSMVANQPVIVVGSWTKAIQDYYGDKYKYAIQTEINGTGGAVAAAIDQVDTSVEAAPVLILYADTPFISIESLVRLQKQVQDSVAVLTMYTVKVDDYDDWRDVFTTFGRIVRDSDGKVKEIVEYKVANDKVKKVCEVNPAVYCVKASWLKSVLPKIVPNPISGERYLTDLVALARQDGYEIDTITLPVIESFGFNSMADIEKAKKLHRC